MNNPSKASPPCLMEYVTALEGKTSLARGKQVQAVLEGLGLPATIQESHRLHIKNIIVDFPPDYTGKRLLFTAHYDVLKGSPGANDNASGVSVLLGLCHLVRNTQVPLRIIFFDREEAWLRTPLFRLGLLGSLYYVGKAGVKDVSAVYNLEFCGAGDCLAIWPVRGDQTGLPSLRQVTRAAARLGLPFKSAHIPWMLLSSDHLSFRLKGIADSLTLSLLPGNQIPAFEQTLAELSLWKLARRRIKLPEPLCFIHSNEDSSSRLDESSLRLMLSLLLEIVFS
jgi:hypothetical protein